MRAKGSDGVERTGLPTQPGQGTIATPAPPNPPPITTRLNLNLTEPARQRLDEYCQKTGKKITAVVTEGINWVLTMDACAERGDRVIIVSPDNTQREILLRQF